MLEGHPAISRFYLYDKAWKRASLPKRLSKELGLLRTIRKAKYDIVLNLTEGDRGALAAKVSKAPIRIGFDPENSGMKGKRGCYTEIVRICHGERHTVERHLDVLRVLGIRPPPDERALYFHIPDEISKKMAQILQDRGARPKEFILIHPVSRWLFKSLPIETVAEVIKELDRRGKALVISSSPDPAEMAMVDQIISLVPSVPLINLAGQTTLKELGALIAHSELLFTVDSVPLHISSALKAPVVTVFGPTSEKSWAPWQNPKSRVVVKPMPCRPCYRPGCGGSGISDCLETLEVKAIIDAIDSLIL